MRWDMASVIAWSKCPYSDVMMSTMASQITSLTIAYSTVYSDADQRKPQSSASLSFVRGIHRGPVNSPHKGPVTRKMFDNVIMDTSEMWIGQLWLEIICCSGTNAVEHILLLNIKQFPFVDILSPVLRHICSKLPISFNCVNLYVYGIISCYVSWNK